MPYPAADLFPSDVLFPGSGDVSHGATGATVVLNGMSLTTVDAFGVSWSTFMPLEGWDGSTSSSLSPTQKTRGAGAWGSPRNLTPRSITLTGLLDAPSVDAAVDAMDRLVAAVTLSGSVLTVARGVSARSAIVYRQGAPTFSEITASLFGWTVDLIALDPRKFTTALSGSTGQPSTTGGVSFPITFPVTFASTVVSGRCQLTNPGNAVGPVVLRIDGPVVGPQVTHVASGLQLVFGTSLTLGAGEYLTVDMEAQVALANGQSSRNSFLVSRGWSGFDPGANTWAFTATSGSGLLTVTATPSWQ